MNGPYDDESSSDAAIELRVLHGPQAGSTLPLEPGQAYTLGTADTCEVLLAGTQVEPEHVSLTADPDGIQITPLQGRVMTLDRGEVASGQVLPLGTVMRLGRVKVTVDSVDSPWPDDDLLEEVEPPPAAAAAEPEDALTEEPIELPAAPARSLRRAPRKRNLVPAVVLGAVTVILMGAALAAWLTSEPPPQEVAEPVTEPVAPVAQAPASAPQPEKRVITDIERLAMVSAFLDKKRVPGEMELNVQKVGSGALRITGAAGTLPALAAVEAAARTELVDAAPIEFAVLQRADLPAKLEERLRAAGLSHKFRVNRREPVFELQAVLTNAEVRTWEKLFEDFTRDYGGVLTIAAQVQHERDRIEGQIETVVGGAFPYLVTTSGQRIAPGGALEGRTLMSIREGEISFSDGLRVRYAN